MTDRPLKLFFWPASSQDGSFLYRLGMQRDELLKRGHEVQTSHFMSDWARKEADAIVGQRVVSQKASWMFQQLAQEGRRRGRRHMVMELDDDLFAIDPAVNPFAKIFKEPGIRENLADNLRHADLVTVSTAPLRDALSRFNGNIVVLPNSVREEAFSVPLNPRRGTDYPVVLLGWQGSSTHVADWALIRDAVAAVLDVEPSTRLRFLGTPYGEGLPRARLDFRPWTTDLMQHYRRVTQFDIGLAPLTESAFNNAKSGLKYVEYATLGVPAICSDVPAYRDLVDHGRTGFLARSPQQWITYMRDLVNDSDLRRKVGDAAREVARSWTIEDRITMWEDAYRSLL